MLMIPAVGSGTYSPGPNHMVVPPHSSSLTSQKRLEPQYKRDRPTRLHRSQNPRYSLFRWAHQSDRLLHEGSATRFLPLSRGAGAPRQGGGLGADSGLLDLAYICLLDHCAHHMPSAGHSTVACRGCLPHHFAKSIPSSPPAVPEVSRAPIVA